MSGAETTLSGMAGPGRLDKALADASGLSRARVQALLGEGRVRLDGRAVAQASLKLSAETPFVIDLPAAVPAEAGAEAIALTYTWSNPIPHALQVGVTYVEGKEGVSEGSREGESAACPGQLLQPAETARSLTRAAPAG